ncbi:hypothetical protein [Kineococcus sp. SYSU DK002]|uniref:hypothetical protein n=1 Tax=Kineococcus sp. SYSU DK002 TaxID=3383123 RepID=UPI003D7EA1DE
MIATQPTVPGSSSHMQAPWVPAPALVTASTIAGLLVVAAYTGGVLLPYFVNDLHHLTYEQLTSGAHDPKDLWPAGAGVLGAWVHLAGLSAVVLGWLVTAPAAVVSAFALRSALGHRSTAPGARRRLALHVIVVALLVSATVVRFTPLGAALATWSLD